MPAFIHHKGARHTIGADRDEEPRAACADNVWPFDEMLEHRVDSKAYAYARAAASMVCEGCPLRWSCEFAVTRRAA